jgi:hypothetical protein
MDRNAQALNMIPVWLEKIGRREAMKRLIGRGVALTTVEKLLAGRYYSTPRDMLAGIIIEEMGRDGFSVDPQAS